MSSTRRYTTTSESSCRLFDVRQQSCCRGARVVPSSSTSSSLSARPPTSRSSRRDHRRAPTSRRLLGRSVGSRVDAAAEERARSVIRLRPGLGGGQSARRRTARGDHSLVDLTRHHHDGRHTPFDVSSRESRCNRLFDVRATARQRQRRRRLFAVCFVPSSTTFHSATRPIPTATSNCLCMKVITWYDVFIMIASYQGLLLSSARTRRHGRRLLLLWRDAVG